MRARVQVFEASAAYQLLVLAAGIDSGAFGPADRRILLVSANSAVPEIAGRIDDDPAVTSLLTRFDAVHSYNDLVAPLHPSEWRPRRPELPIHERAFRAALGIAADAIVELAIESVHVPPGRSLLAIFGASPATVYAEGLMSYGPTRDPIPVEMVSRIRCVRYLDLVPGLAPLLLTEYAVPSVPIAEDAFRAVVAELRPTALPELPGEPYALVLGQYLAALKLLSVHAEAELTADLVEAAARAGHGTVVVKPHPSAPPEVLDVVRKRAEVQGVRLVVSTERAPVEAIYAARPPALVLGCFSTGLVTATRYWGVPAASLGTDRVLRALPRAEDSNRIPLVLVDRTVPHVEEGLHGIAPTRADPLLEETVRTVAYTMQWRAHDEWRDAAARALAARPADFAELVPRARLKQLALPGGWPTGLSAPAFRRGVDLLIGVRRRQLRLSDAIARRPAKSDALATDGA